MYYRSTAVPRSTGGKRKLATSNENITLAKKSLLSSYTPQRPAVPQSRFLRPTEARTPQKTPFKSPKPQRPPRVLATTLNNRSVSIDKVVSMLEGGNNTTILIVFQSRKSGNFKRKKSVGKNSTTKKYTPSKLQVPKIVFSTIETEESDSYDTFQVSYSFFLFLVQDCYLFYYSFYCRIIFTESHLQDHQLYQALSKKSPNLIP